MITDARVPFPLLSFAVLLAIAPAAVGGTKGHPGSIPSSECRFRHWDAGDAPCAASPEHKQMLADGTFAGRPEYVRAQRQLNKQVWAAMFKQIHSTWRPYSSMVQKVSCCQLEGPQTPVYRQSPVGWHWVRGDTAIHSRASANKRPSVILSRLTTHHQRHRKKSTSATWRKICMSVKRRLGSWILPINVSPGGVGFLHFTYKFIF